MGHRLVASLPVGLENAARRAMPQKVQREEERHRYFTMPQQSERHPGDELDMHGRRGLILDLVVRTLCIPLSNPDFLVWQALLKILNNTVCTLITVGQEGLEQLHCLLRLMLALCSSLFTHYHVYARIGVDCHSIKPWRWLQIKIPLPQARPAGRTGLPRSQKRGPLCTATRWHQVENTAARHHNNSS